MHNFHFIHTPHGQFFLGKCTSKLNFSLLLPQEGIYDTNKQFLSIGGSGLLKYQQPREHDFMMFAELEVNFYRGSSV